MALNESNIDVQIDTGASVSIISAKLFRRLQPYTRLNKPDCRLKSYSKHPIAIAGHATVPVTYKDNTTDVKFYVVELNQPAILSGEASSRLGLIERIHGVEDLPEFTNVKKATGVLPGLYSLKVDPSMRPVVHGPRRQPCALAAKIKAKLDEMVSEQHIVRVTEPTDWVSSMVTVLKKDKVRICIDPRDLNAAIKREHYPIPTVEEVVADIPRAKYFSVLDAKSGFLQIKLTHESSLLTTFNTPYGRYRWLRLPFGIRSCPEIYQQIMDDMLEGIKGARAIMDDILIAAETVDEHDKILKSVLDRAT